MARLYDLARMTTATTGTGTITLGSAVASYLTFAQAGVANGDTVTYAIEDGSSREIGRGVYTSSGTTLTRATILRSTNSNAAISLSGSAQVFIAAAAEDIAPQTAAEQLTVRTTLFAAPLDTISCNNLIINGQMAISQRYAATEQTALNSSLNYILDQWEERVSNSNSGVYAAGQVTSTFPDGFATVFRFRATTGAALGSGDYQFIQQKIEGSRLQRLNWGSANALPVSFGFWVRSTITGTMTAGLQNGTNNRTYLHDLTINAANTWEWKTFTFPGLTDVSITNDTTAGLILRLCFGAGSTFQQTADSWGTTANKYGTSSTTNFFATSSNAVHVTGVVLLPGSDMITSAMSALAQPRLDEDMRRAMRYWYTFNTESILAAMVGVGAQSSTTQLDVNFPFPVPLAAVPSLSISAAADFEVWVAGNNAATSAIAMNKANNTNCNLQCTHAVSGAGNGQAGYLVSKSTSARLHFNARM